MIGRRQFGIGAAAMVAGDKLVRPVNAPRGTDTPVGVQPGSNSPIVRARQVIVSGNGDGVFIYSGAPGLGNPPIAWMGAGLVDPYGNVLPSTTGVASTGTFQAGDTRITTAGIFVYSSTPAAGNLIYSEVGGVAGGTDPYGNAYLAGTTTYFPADAYALQTINNEIVLWTAASQAGPYTRGTALIAFNASPASVTIGGQVYVSQYVILTGQAAPAETATSATAFATAAGSLAVVDGSDGNTYGTERAVLYPTNVSGAITTAAAVNIAPFLWPVSARAYQVTGQFIVNCTVAGTPEIEFAMPGGSVGQVGVVTTRAAVLIAAAQLSPNVLGGMGALAAGDTYLVNFTGLIVSAASGNLAIDMAASGGVGSFTVAAYSYANIMPV
jgi:hypothetical protein